MQTLIKLHLAENWINEEAQDLAKTHHSIRERVQFQERIVYVP
jgi:hypothetical protein